jgi:hypothetical protein
MRITIDHCRYTPKWETLQQVIREATNDESASITRINRKDGGCNYRAPGEYDLDVRRDNQTILPVHLDVRAVGQPDPDAFADARNRRRLVTG